MKRTVLVTGGNRGIGFVIARQLAERGNRVLLGARHPGAGDDAAESLRRSGLDIEPVHLDLTDPAAMDSTMKHSIRSGRQIDVLINNAGVLQEKPLLELTDEEIG